MAANITPSLRSALERIKHSGAVNGLLLGWRRQLLINMLPFEGFRAERLLQNVHDGRDHFSSGEDRKVQSFWFGYDVCHVLACFKGESTLVILHTRAEEGDFIKRAAETFLEDCQLLVDGLLNPRTETPEDTQPLETDEEPASYSDTHTHFIGR